MKEKLIEIISKGEFEDEGYKLAVFTVRLFGKLREDFYDSEIINVPECYEKSSEYFAYVEQKKNMRDIAIDNIKNALPIKNEVSYTVKKVLHEIFTIIAFYKI